MDNKIKELFAGHKGGTAYNTVMRTMHTHGMDEMIEGGVLLGLSGGADSVFLACLLHEYRRRSGKDFTVLLFHVNHGIRGEEAVRDEEFSRSFAASLGFEFYSLSVDVPTLAKERGIGVEEMAREVRYSAFDNIIRGRNDISTVATAHNATDNVETVIFNITRGSGTRGASGIAPVRDNIIRPLIELPKSHIVELLEMYNIEYVTDSTNYSDDYSRNYIRHEILPRLMHINPRFEEAFTAFSDAVRCDSEYIENSLDLDFARCEKIDRDTLSALMPAVLMRALVAFCEYNGVERPERRQLNAIASLLSGDNFRYSVGNGKDFVCERGKCYFADRFSSAYDEDFCIELSDGENKLGDYSGVITLGKLKESSLNVYKISIQQDLSSAIIVGVLRVRFKKEGDAYFYGGMTHKLKKVFNDRGIPPSRRSRIPVVFDDKGIVWVPGLGVRDDGNVSDGKSPISFSIYREANGKELYSALTEA